jgi:hypothetical protein
VPAFEKLTGGNGQPQTAAVHNIERRGYTEQEYTVAGTARPEAREIALFADSENPELPEDDTRYKTRILVYRPEDDSKFNGTVLIDWMNVTQQRDAPVTWINSFEYLMREGYAVVLLSAQRAGVENSSTGRNLKSWDSERYNELNHPGDAYSYDILSQTAQGLKREATGDPLEGLNVESVLAAGMSQSGYYLNRYIAHVHPRHGVVDGFLSVAARVLEPELPSTETPTILLNTEDELPAQSDQPIPDSEQFRYWQVAGASHINVYLSVWIELMEARDFGAEPLLAPGEEWTPAFAGQYGYLTGVPYGICGTNYFPVRYAYRSALERVRDWVHNGDSPPRIDRIETEGGEVVTDEFGNAKGGLRLPVIEHPVASYLARQDSCDLLGTTERFSNEQIAALYSSREQYLSALERAAENAVTDGILLATDRDTLLRRAKMIDFPNQRASGDESDRQDSSNDVSDETDTERSTDQDSSGGATNNRTDSDDEPNSTGRNDGNNATGTDPQDADDSGSGFGVPAAVCGTSGVYLLSRHFANEAKQSRSVDEADN